MIQQDPMRKAADTDKGAADIDYIVRATALDGQVRAFACRTTGTCREAVLIHGLSPLAAAAFGRLMSGILMMTQDLDQPGDSLTAVIRCEGPLQGMTVIGEQNATVRGSVLQPVVETVYRQPGKLAVGAAIGKGTLTIIRDLQLREPYTGRVQLVSGEIAEDLAHYLAVSEQALSLVNLGVKMDQNGITCAGGLMVQLLPGAEEETIGYLEKRAAGFPDVSSLLEEGFTPHQLLDLLLGDPEICYHAATPCAYACTCSRERMERNLIALGRTELAQLADDPAGIQLVCHFCNQTYAFSQPEVRELIRQSRQE